MDQRSSVCADGAAEEADEPINGGCVVGDGLGRAEPASARHRGELDSGEGQCLLGQVLRQLSGLAGGLGEIPAVGQEIDEAYLQPLSAGGSSEGAVECPLEDSGLLERGLQRDPGVAVRAGRVVAKVVGTAVGRGLVGQEGDENQVPADQMVDQVVHGPVGARGGRRPLIVSDPGDQVTDGAARTGEMLGRRGCRRHQGPPCGDVRSWRLVVNRGAVGKNRRMGSLLLVTGPPGAGKSTVARILADRVEPSALVEGDAFFGFLARGAIPPWLPESNDQNDTVTQAAASAAGRYASGEYTTIYDGVVGPWFLPTSATATGLARLDYLVLLPSLERCVKRVGTRQGHGFTDEEATRKMHGEFARAAVDRRHLLLDPPDEPEDVADLVAAALASGALACYRPPSQSSGPVP